MKPLLEQKRAVTENRFERFQSPLKHFNSSGVIFELGGAENVYFRCCITTGSGLKLALIQFLTEPANSCWSKQFLIALREIGRQRGSTVTRTPVHVCMGSDKPLRLVDAKYFLTHFAITISKERQIYNDKKNGSNSGCCSSATPLTAEIKRIRYTFPDVT
ncbi:hypothetical protein CBL_03941 [Carabus blaptoides fortunei]